MDNIARRLIMQKVTATEFQQNVGLYNDIAMREPVIITKQGREKLVIMSIEDYNSLKSVDTRKVIFPEDMDAELLMELNKPFVGEPTPEIDHLMK